MTSRKGRTWIYQTKHDLLDIDRERCFVWQATILTKKEKNNKSDKSSMMVADELSPPEWVAVWYRRLYIQMKNRSFIIACQ